MSGLRRFGRIITGILQVACGVLMIAIPDKGYLFMVGLLSLSLSIAGLRALVYYFTMARHMVGGKRVLYQGVLLYDAGVFAGSLTTVPQFYVMLYLIGCKLFAGVISLFKAREERQMDSPSWKLTLLAGLSNIGLAIACLFFMQSLRVAVYLYCIGFIYSGCLRVVQAFQKTAIVYIP